jgi:hypothetical protein
MKITIWEILSLSVIFLTYIPLLLAILSKTSIDQTKHITGFLGAISTLIISEGLKNTLFYPESKTSILARPKNAADCNTWCTDGPQGGKPGFPSTHSATTTFLTAYYYNDIGPAAIPFWAAILYSRVAKSCHNWWQIGAGIILGYLICMIIA